MPLRSLWPSTAGFRTRRLFDPEITPELIKAINKYQNKVPHGAHAEPFNNLNKDDGNDSGTQKNATGVAGTLSAGAKHHRHKKVLSGKTLRRKSSAYAVCKKDYDAFCEYYFPHFLQLRDKVTGEVIRTIHNAPFHSAAARKVKTTPNLKAVFKWPRGHAKSTHMDIFTPLWLMFQPKRLINFMALVGKSENSDKPTPR